MKHLSLFSALLLSSSLVSADTYTIYAEGDGKTPNGACWEMMCEYGCTENNETGEGICCPKPVEGKNCVSNTTDDKKCLLLKKTYPNTQYCNTTTQSCQNIPPCNPCQKFDTTQEKCIPDISKNNTQVQDVCHKCDKGEIVLKDKNKTVVFNDQCVQCIEDSDCKSGICSKNKTCDPEKFTQNCAQSNYGNDGYSSCRFSVPSSYTSNYRAYITGKVQVSGYPRKCWTNGCGILVNGAFVFHQSNCGTIGWTFSRENLGVLKPGDVIQAVGSNNNGSSGVDVKVEFEMIN